jgi:drug/metabolite transporter (DMT)-like permease
MTAAAARTLVAIPICWALMHAAGNSLPRTGREWIALFWLGLLTAAVPFASGAWGQRYIDSGLAGILFGTIPIMAVVLAPIFLEEESFSRLRLIGALTGVAGLVLVVGPSILANAGDQLLGVCITLLAPLSHTLGAIHARRQTGLTPQAMATGQMIFGAAILTPVAFLVEAPHRLHPGAAAVGALLVSGIFCTALAMSLYFAVVRRVGASRSSIVPLLMPMVAVALGALLFDERLTAEAWLGMALILTGARAVSAARGSGSPPAPSQTIPTRSDSHA